MNSREKIYNYPTESEWGFTDKELKVLLSEFGDAVNMDKFNSALMGITCMKNDAGEIVIYHCDILTALRCGLENRDMQPFEMD